MTANQIKDHLRPLGHETANVHDPDESDYYQIKDGKRYLLQDSTQSDGFRINPIAFKLKELLCVKYKTSTEQV